MNENDLIAAGLATYYEGRLIPIMRGGEVVEGEEPPPESEPDAPEPDAPEPEAFALSQEQWDQAQEALSQIPNLAAYLQQMQAANQPQEPQVDFAEEYDPFDPESVKRMIQAEAQALLAEQLGPYQGLLGMISSDKGEELAKAELGRIEGEVGSFDHDMAFMVGSGFLNDEGVDPAQALQQAATMTRDFEQRIRSEERAKVEQEIRELGGAPLETPVGNSAHEGEEIPTGPGKYATAIERVLERRNRSTMPVG
jgi:hypothetical protein